MGVKTEYKTPQRVLAVKEHATNPSVTRREILFELAPRHHLISVRQGGSFREYNLFFPWMYFVVDAWIMNPSEVPVYQRWQVQPRSTNGYAYTDVSKGNASITRIGVARTKQELHKGRVHKFVFSNMYQWGPCHRAENFSAAAFNKATPEQLAEAAVHKWWQLGFNTDFGSSWKLKSAAQTIREEIQAEDPEKWRKMKSPKKLHLMMERWESKTPTAIMNMPYSGTGVPLTGFFAGNMSTKPS